MILRTLLAISFSQFQSVTVYRGRKKLDFHVILGEAADIKT